MVERREQLRSIMEDAANHRTRSELLNDIQHLSARVAQLEEVLGKAAAFISEEAEYRGSMDKDYTTPAVPLLQKIQTALSEKEGRL